MINTKIEYCDSTVNPTRGCLGCELWNPRTGGLCFAAGIHTRYQGTPGYPRPFAEPEPVPGRMNKAARWSDLAPGRMNKAARWSDLAGHLGHLREAKPWLDGRPRVVFIGDLTDTLCEPIPFDYLETEILDQVDSPHGRRHRWLWFSKRPHRMAQFYAWAEARGRTMPPNLIPATSATDAQTLARRLVDLYQIPARLRILSLEPLLGPVDLREHLADIDRGRLWVIAGGASGTQAKPTPPDWFRAVRDDCEALHIPFFFKQWGQCNEAGARVGKAFSGRTLDGRQHNDVPEL